MHNIDTPFLLNNAHKHTKTYVAPSPDISNLSAEEQCNGRESVDLNGVRLFPRLNLSLFSPPRRVKIPFEPSSAFNIGWSSDRLKRMASIAVTSVQDSNTNHETAGSRRLTQASCLFSVYIALLSNAIVFMGSRQSKHPQIAAVGAMTSTSRLLDEFGTSTVTGDDTPERLRRKSSIDLSYYSPGALIAYEEDSDVKKARAAAMTLGLKVLVCSLFKEKFPHVRFCRLHWNR